MIEVGRFLYGSGAMMMAGTLADVSLTTGQPGCNSVLDGSPSQPCHRSAALAGQLYLSGLATIPSASRYTGVNGVIFICLRDRRQPYDCDQNGPVVVMFTRKYDALACVGRRASLRTSCFVHIMTTACLVLSHENSLIPPCIGTQVVAA
jgi:hypothetical protein